MKFKPLIFLCLALILLRLTSINYSLTDEPIYLNMASAIRQGAIPYSDFSFAHPPLMLYLFVPFSFNLLTARLGLLLIQLLIIIVADKILTHKGVSEINSLIICSIIVINPAFYHLFNSFLGFGLMTLFCLSSYYYYLKGDHKKAVLFASIGLMTRLFSVFYIIALIIITYKEHKGFYLLSFVPLIITVILLPLMLDQVFLYHVDSVVGKDWMDSATRLKTIIWFPFIYALPLAFMFIKPIDYETTMITSLFFLGVFAMKTVYLMYISLFVVWVMISGLSKLSSKQLLIVLCLSFVVLGNYCGKVVMSYIPISEVNSIIVNLSVHGLPLTGNPSFMNLLSWAGQIPIVGSYSEPSGMFDTVYHRVGHESFSYLDKISLVDHLFIHIPVEEGYIAVDSMIDKSDYELVFVQKNLEVYKYEV